MDSNSLVLESMDLPFQRARASGTGEQEQSVEGETLHTPVFQNKPNVLKEMKRQLNDGAQSEQ